jgi:hypothetical protein
MKLENRISKFYPDTVPVPRWSPPPPPAPDRIPVAFWVVVGWCAGLATAWLMGVSR